MKTWDLSKTKEAAKWRRMEKELLRRNSFYPSHEKEPAADPVAQAVEKRMERFLEGKPL